MSGACAAIGSGPPLLGVRRMPKEQVEGEEDNELLVIVRRRLGAALENVDPVVRDIAGQRTT